MAEERELEDNDIRQKIIDDLIHFINPLKSANYKSITFIGTNKEYKEICRMQQKMYHTSMIYPITYRRGVDEELNI